MMAFYEGIGLGVTTDRQTVVLDIGYAYTKYGFTGEAAPRGFIRTEAALPENKSRVKIFDHLQDNKLYDLLVEFIHHLYFRKLLVSPKDRRVVIVESLLCPTSFRDTLAKVFFRHFDVASLLFLPSQLAALCTLGTDTALLVDLGYREATVVPVYAGVPVLRAWQAQPIAGEAVERRIREQLAASEGSPCDLSSEQIEDIKVRTCFVTTLERSQKLSEVKPPPSVDYPVACGRHITVPGNLRETAFEVLFEEDGDQLSLSNLILDAILECATDARRQLAENIFIVGGTAMVPGLRARLRDEMRQLLGLERYASKLSLPNLKFHRAPAKENYAAWLGGAIFGATDSLVSRSLTKESYMKTNCVPDWANLYYNRPSSEQMCL
ncbi:actin-related protein 10 isoform X1 [Schistocerca serialis cubense]|uniref:actin-related protein 10 isoform X1 n=1 Tax=Schistocerca serialis cubense TaxID=2023355 RepID=UPI00214E1BD4|nr:actin-related protein 10 isoform X1 [Schistocerca serialis cubense]